ncbi:MAG: 1-acyl-sn-glycerol-3-phosphate acyltransferase [bacterium]
MSRLATLGAPRRGRPWLQAIGRSVLGAWQWRIVGALPELPKFVIIVAPHTSNWDFPVGVFAMFALDVRIHWFGKESLFRSPLGWIFRRLDGRPVRRDAPEGVVTEMADIVRGEPQFLLALAPEGTRKPVAQWRSGFYHIAHAAEVPIVPVWFDWSRHEIGIGAPMCTSGNVATDLTILQSFYRPEMGRDPRGYVVAGPDPLPRKR